MALEETKNHTILIFVQMKESWFFSKNKMFIYSSVGGDTSVTNVIVIVNDQ